ncbi:MAG: right-handed parallel beta-helix repeat-containing protein [Planctomycetota bacterium]
MGLGFAVRTDTVDIRSASYIIAASDSAHQGADKGVATGADAALAIVAGINALGANGGKIKLLAGTYEIKSTVAIPNNIILEGETAGNMNARYTNPGTLTLGTVLQISGSAGFSIVGAKTTQRDYVHSIGLRHLQIEYVGTQPPGSRTVPIRLDYAADCWLHGVVFKDFDTAVELTRAWDVNMTECAFSECGFGEKAAVSLRHGSVFTERQCAGLRFVDCTWQGRPGFSVLASPNPAPGFPDSHADVNFLACKFESGGSGRYPAIVGFFQGATISSCWFYDVQELHGLPSEGNAFIHLRDSSNCVVSGNRFAEFDQYAIAIEDGWYNLVSGNHIDPQTTPFQPDAACVRLRNTGYNPTIYPQPVNYGFHSLIGNVYKGTIPSVSETPGWIERASGLGMDTDRVLDLRAEELDPGAQSPVASGKYLPVKIDGALKYIRLYHYPL